MIGNKEKCLNPWFGFLIILGVCTLISAAVFFRFKGKTRHHQLHHVPTTVNKAAMPAAFPSTGVDTPVAGDKFAF
ncbi:MAG: hypothetical protein HQL24_02830 [Candidatus Omnitrophica bacterium]|nr:hypothetical protein [Candidatus Omnitrophota bacterium]